MTGTRTPRARRTQRGAVLVVSLLLLTVVTLLGVTSMRTTVLEQRMSGNMQDRDRAFHPAEAALPRAEARLAAALHPVVDLTGSDGLLGLYDAAPAAGYFADSTWQGVQAYGDYDSDKGVASPPRYIINWFNLIDPYNSINVSVPSYGNPGGGDIHLFRITARGLGGAATTRTWLQETYGSAL
mgnify:CR=1 FL=1